LGASVPLDDPSQAEDWKTLLAVRNEVLKALEEARQSKLIGGANLEAQVTVTAAEPILSVLGRYQAQLRYLFIVSAVTLESGAPGNGTGGVSVRVAKADGKKCERCWNYSIHVGEDAVYPTVCERCSAVLKELGA
jgi:isoleucyl-tRNA synthetase